MNNLKVLKVPINRRMD